MDWFAKFWNKDIPCIAEKYQLPVKLAIIGLAVLAICMVATPLMAFFVDLLKFAVGAIIIGVILKVVFGDKDGDKK